MEQIVVKSLPVIRLPQEWWSELGWEASQILDRCIEACPTIKPSCRRTALETQFPSRWRSSASISPSPRFMHISSTFLFKCAWHCTGRGEEEEGHKYHPGSNHAVQTLTLGKKCSVRSNCRERDRKFPLSSGCGRGGVTHPAECHNAKWLLHCFPLWGVIRGRASSGMWNPPLLAEALCLAWVLWARQSFQGRVKGQRRWQHHSLLPALYNCPWSASSLLVKCEAESSPGAY